MLAEKRSALIGRALAEKHGWKVVDTIPLICTIFPKQDNSAWEFTIIGVFEKLKQNIDENTMFFRFDYLEDTMRYGGAAPVGSGTYFVQLGPGAGPTETIEEIDALFANGPQRTKTYTEAAFQQGFVSMMGNVPLFLGTIGGAVVIAVFFSVVNAMLISGRQRMRESGILQALGFRARTIGALVGLEALLLCALGGSFGILLSAGAGEAIRAAFPGFSNLAVAPETLAQGLALALGIGVVAAVPPWVILARTKPTDALRDVQ
jgi:putative ABC transport system permease protein